MRLKTAHKIALARAAFYVTHALRKVMGLSPVVEVSRGGVRWQLDLREGIDFSIYLLGAFERRTIAAYAKVVQPGAVAIDIGANIGAHTLPLARLVGPGGHVIAFEPTAFAIRKLRSNIALNPALAARITVCQIMLVGRAGDALQTRLFASWPLTTSHKLHEKNRGQLMATDGALASTLDDDIEARGLQRIHFIKLDVDGHEFTVLQGATKTLERFRPILVMELAPHEHIYEGHSFEDLVELLVSRHYTFCALSGDKRLPQSALGLRAMVPDGAGMNVLLVPR